MRLYDKVKRIGLTDRLFRIFEGAMGNRLKLFRMPKFVERIRLPDEVLKGRSFLPRWAGSYMGAKSGRQVDSLVGSIRTGIKTLPTRDNRVHLDIFHEPLQMKALDRLRKIIRGRGGNETETRVGGNEPNEPGEKGPSLFSRIKSKISSLWNQYKFGGTHWAFRKTVYSSLKGNVEARNELRDLSIDGIDSLNRGDLKILEWAIGSQSYEYGRDRITPPTATRLLVDILEKVARSEGELATNAQTRLVGLIPKNEWVVNSVAKLINDGILIPTKNILSVALSMVSVSYIDAKIGKSRAALKSLVPASLRVAAANMIRSIVNNNPNLINKYRADDLARIVAKDVWLNELGLPRIRDTEYDNDEIAFDSGSELHASHYLRLAFLDVLQAIPTDIRDDVSRKHEEYKARYDTPYTD